MNRLRLHRRHPKVHSAGNPARSPSAKSAITAGIPISSA